MIVVKVRDRDIKAAPMGPVTTGSVGLPVSWHFSEEWDDLAKTAVFRVGNDGTEITVAVLEDLCLVPDELLVQANAGENLWIGVYGWKGTNANDTIVPEIAMPTIWTYTRIQDGSQPSGIEPPEGTPGWSAQIQNATDEALRVAHGVAADAAEGDFDGISPEVTISSITHGHSVTITDRDHPTGQSFNVMDGDSAYEQAVAGGYTGTEAQFNEELASFKELSDETKEAAPFYAEYGVTTKAAVVAAINGKRQVYVSGTLGMDYAPLVGTFLYTPLFGEELQTGYRFAIVEGTTQYIYDLADEWSSSTNDLSAPAQRAEAAAAQALIRMNSADASAQAAAGSASDASTAATTATTKAGEASDSATAADGSAKDAEAYAIGKRGGTDVSSSDPAYHNNAKYYAQQASGSATAASGSATSAASSATAAGNAQTAAETAQGAAEDAQEAAEAVLESIPADYTELSGDVDDLKNAIKNRYTDSIEGFTGCRPVWFEIGYYYTTPSVGEAPVITKHDNWMCAKTAVSPGNAVVTHTRAQSNQGTLSALAWLDSDGGVLSKITNITGDRLFSAPAGAAYVVLNNQATKLASGYFAYVGEEISYQRIFGLLSGDIASATEGITGCRYEIFQHGFYSTPANGSASVFTAGSSAYESVKITVSEGDVINFHIGNDNTSSPKAYALLDSLDDVVSSGTDNDAAITIPSGVSSIVINNRLSETHGLLSGFYAYKGNSLKQIATQALQNKGIANTSLGISSCDNFDGNSIYFVSYSSGVSYVSDFPLNAPGWLMTATNSSNAMQFAFPWNVSGDIKYRTRKSGAWQAWRSIKGAGDTYNNTYNITTTPSFTTDTNGWLQPIDTASTAESNATDMTGAIMSLLSNTGYCHLAPGVYWVSGGIDMPNGAVLEGCGNDTVVKLLSSVTSGYCIKTSQQCQVKNLSLDGGDSSSWKSGTIGNRHGIYYIANADGQETAQTPGYDRYISDCTISGFSGNGIYQHNTGGGIQQGLHVTNCFIQHCTVGINIDYYSEYCKYIGNVIFACYYACINNGGNNVFSNCTFHGKVGFVIDNASGTKRNNAHGSCVGCVFNHINNTDADGSGLGGGDAVVITSVNNGFIFTGCQIWYGAIKVNSSRCIQFSDCLIGGGTPVITVTGSNPAFFSSCIFHDTPTLTLGASGTKFDNCYDNSGTAIGT